MSDKWEGLLGGPLPVPITKRPVAPDRSIPWMRLLGLVLVLALIGLGVWRATSRSANQSPAPVTAPVDAESSGSQSTPTPAPSLAPYSVDTSGGEKEEEPPVGAESTPAVDGLFDGAHRVVDDYAHVFYDRADGEEWTQVVQKIQGLATTAWAVELTNSPELQDTMLAPMMRVVDVAVTVEDANPQTPTQWAGTLALVFEDEEGNRVERSVNAGVEVVPGVGWRITRWEEVGNE